ncbi:MAG: DUF1223 domain-containing protein [Rubrivivax sp.]|nr:DUF1223 domain-containing protein [Rubrivivax sp.]
MPLPAATLASILLAFGPAQAADTCQATSGDRPTLVVELYTSEGCSSCPPADRWLSTLKGRSDVLALAFHVNYWDRLGWPDRFATPEATARQKLLAQRAGRSGVYTPQVLAGGRDWPEWPRLPAATGGGPPLSLQREGDRVTLQVARAADARLLAGYWAVLEDGHASRVAAGENAGATLRHDHVVRLYRPLSPWAGRDGLKAELDVLRGQPGHPRRVAFVLTDAASDRPLQAVVLAC